MVFESTSEYPTPEGAERRCPPPRSTYGFQKLATEYFVQGAWEQYKLPYTIVRPFNCVGIGEKRALHDHDIYERQREAGHVARGAGPGAKGAEGPGPAAHSRLRQAGSPLHLRRRSGQGIRVTMEHPSATNQDFNLSTAARTTVLELAEAIWRKVHGDSKPFRFVSDPPFEYDVQERSPDVRKARQMLGLRGHHQPGADPGRGYSLGGGANRGRSNLVIPPETPAAYRSRSSFRSITRRPIFRALWQAVCTHIRSPFRALVVYDFDADNTVPVVQQIIDAGRIATASGKERPRPRRGRRHPHRLRCTSSRARCWW